LQQGVQDDAPLKEKVPAKQTVEFKESNGQYEPAGQIIGLPEKQ
jgi:hypothetical protein